MKILGIETSCDDTGISIIEARGRKNSCFRNVQISNFTLLERFRQGRITFRILANHIASQVKIHQQYGGVYPNLAKREHETNLPIVLKKVLKATSINPKPWQEIDAIAITRGPGLSPCLWVGLNWAKDLAKKWNVPLIPVNHMEGHLLISLFSQGNENSKSEARNPKQVLNTKYKILSTKNTFPAIALLVSGGHTQLVLVTSLGRYKILGETRDDAAGECFDKTARILGLPYPGGPAIATAATQYNIQDTKYKIRLPRPMMHTKDYDFSFSGLKTAVLYDWKSRSKKVKESAEYISEMAREIQQAIIDVLISKTAKAAQAYNAQCVILGGGVAANEELRRQLSQILHTRYQIPLLAAPKALCTDNGAMIAVAGYVTWLRTKPKKMGRIEANPNLRL